MQTRSTIDIFSYNSTKALDATTKVATDGVLYNSNGTPYKYGIGILIIISIISSIFVISFIFISTSRKQVAPYARPTSHHPTLTTPRALPSTWSEF